MVNLLLRSTLVLALLFGLLFAVGMMAVAYFDLSIWVAVAFALGTLALQYLIGPYIIEWIYKIRWIEVEQVSPELARFIEETCASRELPFPRFGVIDDGNPNAFTFGHYPGDARLVVTRGILELLTPAEVNSVVGHELGHIAHWDFVVMTVAGAVPLLLYLLARFAWGAGRGRKQREKGGGYIALVGLIAYVAYFVSQYIVLLLSRVREYYADRFSGEVTGQPDSLARALIKIAYGLASAPQEGVKKDDTRMVAGRAFGIFDPQVAQALALAGAGTGVVSTAAMTDAMKWDLWNPWAMWYELSSSHPLPAKRIRALEKQTEALNQMPSFSFRAEQPESYWDEFLVDFAINSLPGVGFLVGAGVTVAGVLSGLPLAGAGVGLLTWGAAWWLKRRFVYPRDMSQPRTVSELVSEVKVSRVRAVPGTLRGRIIGKGIPGLYWSEDLVLQDRSGYIVLDYRQPARLWETLFGLLRVDSLIGMKGEARGWFRRTPRPLFELRELELDDGRVIKTYVYPLGEFANYAVLALGVLALVAQAAGLVV
ncbi:MAG: M48 family metalloprotease [Chloroflexi bacterium]|nr:M48 family metalloprotease [Chloroflexota bacterium]